MSLELPPLSLYIHLPWCVRKCPYCDFNSHEVSENLPESEYLKALRKDWALDAGFVQGRPITSIFFGGGTPSLLSGPFYKELLSFLAEQVDFEPSIEITLEANPGTVDSDHFDLYREAGINRLSLGVQSFNDEHLQALGRIHSSAQAVRAIERAKQAGFDNFNIDLMHGLPDQTVHQAVSDIEQALALSPRHLSWYQLTIEPNTAFYSSPPRLPIEDRLWDIQQEGLAVLGGNGFKQYEVSAFSLSGARSRHNLNYWTFGDYIGLGAGAHSKCSFKESKRILRYRKSRLPKDYLAPRPVYRVAEEHIQEPDLPFEFMMNVLRLHEGVDEDLFSKRTALPLSVIEPVLGELRRAGLMAPEKLQLTDKGYGFLNTVLEKFLPHE